jgi:hypothetical protein
MIDDAVLEEWIGAIEGAEARAVWAGELGGIWSGLEGMSDRSKVDRVLGTHCDGGPDQIVGWILGQVDPAEEPVVNRLQEFL